jgi:DNA/RNA-binding domain of Phe-tRNA-synthetase-like protein
MKDLKFSVTKEILQLGVKIITARITDVQNSDLNPQFENFKNSELEKIRQEFGGEPYEEDPILAGFRELHKEVKRSNIKYVASPEALRRAFTERNRFPHINTLVDIYNLVSLESGLALGAHDIKNIKGNVTLRITKGDESFIPLGKQEPVPIFPGEYAYIDDGNNILCRLEVLQVEQTKVTKESKDIFLIIQGNTNTGKDLVMDTAKNVCELMTKYCGGTYSLLETEIA